MGSSEPGDKEFVQLAGSRYGIWNNAWVGRCLWAEGSGAVEEKLSKKLALMLLPCPQEDAQGREKSNKTKGQGLQRWLSS